MLHLKNIKNCFSFGPFTNFTICSMLFLTLGLHPILAQQDILIDGLVGVVGDKIILRSEVSIQVEQAKLQGVDRTVDCEIIDQLMLEKLLVNQAEIDSIYVTEDEVEIETEKRLRYYLGLLGSEAKFEEYYGKSVLEFKEEFKPDIEKILIAQRMQGEIINNVKVTPAEVKEFFNEIPKDSLPYYNAEVEIAQIMLKPQVTEAAKEETKEQLRDIRKRIVDGENTFEELAVAYSQDPGSGAQGGNLGFQARGTFVKEFEAAAFKLKKGEMSGIVETQYGFHLLRLIERRGNQINIQHILIKPTLSQTDLDLTKTKGDSIRELLLNDSLLFVDAVDEFSEDENGKEFGGLMVNYQTGSSFFEMSELEPDVFFAVESLKENEVSEPVLIQAQDGSQAYYIFKVQTRTKPHVANLNDDYDRIQQIAVQQKQMTAMNKWVADKAEKTYVFLAPEYQSCETMVKWIK